MEEIIQKMIKLLSVKSLVTLTLTVVFAVLNLGVQIAQKAVVKNREEIA